MMKRVMTLGLIGLMIGLAAQPVLAQARAQGTPPSNIVFAQRGAPAQPGTPRFPRTRSRDYCTCTVPLMAAPRRVQW